MNSLKFEGKGFAFFKIHFVNVILTAISLTLLYPWAKVREIKYISKNIYLAENSFTFTGTVSSFYKGYLRTFLVLLVWILICIGIGVIAPLHQESIFMPAVKILTYVLVVLFMYYFLPILLHGSINYRLDNTIWGDITPSYTGKLSELVPIYFTGKILTTLTGGIYNAWYHVKLFRYLLQKFRFGSLRFDFSGDSKSLFLIYLKGILLTMVTFGIYGIWFTKTVYEYFVNNIVVKKDDQEFKLHSDANTLEVFEMTIGCLLLIVLTLGVGSSWAYMRYYRFIIGHCVIPADFNIGSIHEPQEEEKVLESSQNWLDKWNPVFIA